MTAGKNFARLDGLSAVPTALKGGVVAIGNFDGCHRGHQQVFAAARAMAAKKSHTRATSSRPNRFSIG